MYVCIYICICICIYTCIYVFIHIHINGIHLNPVFSIKLFVDAHFKLYLELRPERAKATLEAVIN